MLAHANIELISLDNDIARLHTRHWRPLADKWLVPIPSPVMQFEQPSGTYFIDAETIAQEGLKSLYENPAPSAEDEKFWRYPGSVPVLTDYGLRFLKGEIREVRRKRLKSVQTVTAIILGAASITGLVAAMVAKHLPW